MKISITDKSKTETVKVIDNPKDLYRRKFYRRVDQLKGQSDGLRPRLKHLGHSDLDETPREGDDVMSTLEAEAAHEAYEQDTRSF